MDMWHRQLGFKSAGLRHSAAALVCDGRKFDTVYQLKQSIVLE